MSKGSSSGSNVLLVLAGAMFLGFTALCCLQARPAPRTATHAGPVVETPAPAPEVPNPLGAWMISRSRSAMTDSEDVQASLMSSTFYADWLGRIHTPVLWISCRENETAVYLNLGAPPEQAHVRMRLDKDEARRHTGTVSTDGNSIFLPSPISRVKELEGHENLIVEWTPFQISPVTAEFRLTGVDVAIADVREACGW
jgi:type VI secretion system VasI family protein